MLVKLSELKQLKDLVPVLVLYKIKDPSELYWIYAMDRTYIGDLDGIRFLFHIWNSVIYSNVNLPVITSCKECGSSIQFNICRDYSKKLYEIPCKNCECISQFVVKYNKEANGYIMIGDEMESQERHNFDPDIKIILKDDSVEQIYLAIHKNNMFHRNLFDIRKVRFDKVAEKKELKGRINFHKKFLKDFIIGLLECLEV